jgi:hypothetical protein
MAASIQQPVSLSEFVSFPAKTEPWRGVVVFSPSAPGFRVFMT